MNHRGFTLIESVITLTVFSIIALVTTVLYISGITQQREESIRSALVVRGGTAIDTFTSDVENAYQIAPSATLGGTTYTSDGSTLVLTLPAFDATGAIILSGNSFVADYVVYRTSVPYTYRSVFPAASSKRRALTDQKLVDKQYADGSTPFGYQDNSGSGGSLQTVSPSAATYVTWFVPMQQQFKKRVVKYNASGYARLRNKA